MYFSENVGCYVLKSNNVVRHFCPDFQVFCSDFQGFFPDFRYIKTFRGALAPPPPTTLLHTKRDKRQFLLLKLLRIQNLKRKMWRERRIWIWRT